MPLHYYNKFNQTIKLVNQIKSLHNTEDMFELW